MRFPADAGLSPSVTQGLPRLPALLLQASGGAGALPEPTEAELEELYRSVDFHPEEQQAAAAAGPRGAGGLHLSLDCLVGGASLLLLDALPAAQQHGGEPQQGRDGQAAAAAPQHWQQQHRRSSSSDEGTGGGEPARDRGGGIAAAELERLKLSVEVQPDRTSAVLTVADASLHDLCSEPGLSSPILRRGSPGSGASAAVAASADVAEAYVPPLVKLHFVVPATGSGAQRRMGAEPGRAAHGGPEPRAQLDVLVQPLLLRVHPVCMQRLVALVPPVVQVSRSCVGGA